MSLATIQESISRSAVGIAATWPYAFSEGAIQLSQQAASAFQAGLDLHPSWKNLYFNTSFNNGSATAQLPAVFLTPDPSKKLPLVIITTGTDYTKEASLAALLSFYLIQHFESLHVSPLSSISALLTYSLPSEISASSDCNYAGLH